VLKNGCRQKHWISQAKKKKIYIKQTDKQKEKNSIRFKELLQQISNAQVFESDRVVREKIINQ